MTASQRIIEFNQKDKLRNIQDLVGPIEDNAIESQGIPNLTAITNPNSPLENEKLQHELEEKQNMGRIDLDVKLSEEQIQAAEKLKFGGASNNKKQKKAKESNDIVGMGLNYKKNQQSLIEFKKNISSVPPKCTPIESENSLE